MHKLVLAATAIALLAGCREAAEGQPENETAVATANDASASRDGNAAGAVNPLGAPIGGDAAKRLMHDRHERMEEIGDAFKVVNRTLKTGSPDIEAIRQSSATIARLAPQVSGWFPPGTGPDVGKTEAKAEIWQKPEDFAAKTRAFQAEARTFDSAARSGDMNAIKSSFGELGKTCKACHDPYREEH